MTRLLILVEGETEETFVNDVLAPHLYRAGYIDVSTRLMGGQRQKSRRGGVRRWTETRRDIVNQLRQDAGLVVTTMVDYYGLPIQGARAWPGRTEANRFPFPQRASHVENAIRSDVATSMSGGFNPARIIPYVMMHEFEAMLFSDCEKFAQAIGRSNLADNFQEIRDAFATPEEIDDSPDGAPSKRIMNLAPDYQKPTDGTVAVSAIGLDTIRGECPHFRHWLGLLERLVTSVV